ncbi:hypothetical protein KC322_g22 [Hortaea werneckii]|nr:hypothetical protein KC322_g22 [Hortaea werneckii]
MGVGNTSAATRKVTEFGPNWLKKEDRKYMAMNLCTPGPLAYLLSIRKDASQLTITDELLGKKTSFANQANAVAMTRGPK